MKVTTEVAEEASGAQSWVEVLKRIKQGYNLKYFDDKVTNISDFLI